MSPNVVNSFGIYPWNFPTGKSTISHLLSVFHDVFTFTVLRSYCSFSFCVRYQVQPRSSRGRVAARRPSMDSCHITGDLLCCCSSSHSCAKLAVMSSSCLHHFRSSELLSKFTQQEMLEGRTYRCENCCGEFQWTCCQSCVFIPVWRSNWNILTKSMFFSLQWSIVTRLATVCSETAADSGTTRGSYDTTLMKT